MKFYMSIIIIPLFDEKNVYINGNGFFIKLYKGNKPLFCLMTNEHVINEEMIKKNSGIIIYYNYYDNNHNYNYKGE